VRLKDGRLHHGVSGRAPASTRAIALRNVRNLAFDAFLDFVDFQLFWFIFEVVINALPGILRQK